MNKFTVSIVIPNWNGADLLRKYLGKLVRVSEGAEIVITDDHSSDDSVDYLKRNFPNVTVVEHSNQAGFAGNINSGVARARGDVVVLLNTDVVPEPGYLKPLIAHFDDPGIFAVGCMDKSYENGKVVYRGRGLARWQNGFYMHNRGEVDRSDTAWVSGGSGAFRRKYWLELGGMDELFNPFYWEDIDLSYRAVKAGYRIVFEPESVVNHYHEEGKIKSDYSPSRIRIVAYRNQFLFIWKHIPDFKIWIESILFTPYRIIGSALSGDTAMGKGFLAALIRLPRIILFRMKFPKQI